MIHYFTFGEDGNRGVFLTTAQADVFNRFARSFFDAQTQFHKEHGRPWHFTEAIAMPFGGSGQLRDDKDLDDYHRLVKHLERQYWIRNHVLHLPLMEKHMSGDFLVKKF